MTLYVRGDSPIIHIPAPLSYKLPTYDVTVKSEADGRKWTASGLTDNGRLSDFVMLELGFLPSLPCGDYTIEVGDGYSTTILRVTETKETHVHTNDIERVVYNG